MAGAATPGGSATSAGGLASLVGGRRPLQPRRLPQDVALQLGQPSARVDPELLTQHAACLLERLQRLGLPARAVQRQHQQPVQALPERIAANQLLELGGGRGMPAKRQLGGQAVLQRGQAKLLQPLPLGLGERLVGHVGQGRPAPQPQRLPQHLGGRPRVARPPAADGPPRPAPQSGRHQGPRAPPPAGSRGLGDQHPRQGASRAIRLEHPA